MTSLRRLHMPAVAAVLLLVSGAVTSAALLRVSPGVPTTTFAPPGTTTYNAGTDTFTVTATPVFEAFGAPIGTKAIATPRALTINIQVDRTGALVGGVAGNDLTLTGRIDTNGDGVYEYSGVLLTGEVLAFGSQNVSTTDVYGFRFSVTGGALQSLYGTNDAGIRLTSATSTFTGSFATSFSGRAQGTIGPIAPLVTNAGRIGDFVWQDTNGNGVQDGDEPGIDGVSMSLLDTSGNTVATTTTGVGPGGQHGYYQFTGLLAGSYAVVVGAGVPFGFTATTATVGADRSIDSNEHPYASVTLSTGSASDQTIDFGYVPPGEEMTVIGWGLNMYGQAGPPKDLISISAGRYHSLGLRSGGTVAGWGYDYYGQATPPSTLSGVVAVAAGGYHSVALKSDGTVVSWGNGDANQKNIPAGLSGVTAISAGFNHTLALKSDGTLVGWGWNQYGEATSPAGLTNVAAVAAGSCFSLALKKDGTVIGWGLNDYGAATPPAGLTNVTAIAAGGDHSLALKSDGTVVGWGNNIYDQATPPADLTNVVAIAAGGAHSLALKSDGTVVAWGWNDDGQATLPVGLTNVVAISAGGQHSLALKLGGTVVEAAPTRR